MDLLSFLGLIAIGGLIVVGRMLLHRWQDKHWSEKHKATDAARDDAVRQMNDARALGNALSNMPNIGSEWSGGSHGHDSGDLAP